MLKKWLVLLLMILLVGCGIGDKSINDADAKTKDRGSGIVVGEMAASLKVVNPLVFQFEVKNQTEEMVTLKFTSSQRFNYSVKTKDGKEVFLYSSVTSFIQVLGEEKLKQGDALTYEIDLHDLNLEAGEYILTAWMTPKEGPKDKVTKEFSIE
jgi:ABC-type molybdate transport system substrate-binding protein